MGGDPRLQPKDVPPPTTREAPPPPPPAPQGEPADLPAVLPGVVVRPGDTLILITTARTHEQLSAMEQTVRQALRERLPGIGIAVVGGIEQALVYRPDPPPPCILCGRPLLRSDDGVTWVCAQCPPAPDPTTDELRGIVRRRAAETP